MCGLLKMKKWLHVWQKKERERERIKTDQMNLKKNHIEFLEVTNRLEIEA